MFFPVVLCWGSQGHEMTGDIAEKFLEPSVLGKVQSVVGSLASVSTWADKIKHSHGYQWTAPLHYANPNDSPTHCGYNDMNDCKDHMCVVGAISNMTHQLLLCDQKRMAESLKFLIHFIGDIGQPLHVCGRERGGNLVQVVFDGHHENLHAIWDTGILVKRMQEFGGRSQYIKHILSLDYTPTEFDMQKLNDNHHFESVIEWANDSSELDCSTVWKGYEDGDLGGEYYERVKSTIDMQLLKSGHRLGQVLNQALASCEVVAQPHPDSPDNSDEEPSHPRRKRRKHHH